MELEFITCCPNDLFYVWTLKVFLSNLRKFGYSDKQNVLVFWTEDRQENKDFKQEWKELMDLFPETNFHFYAAPKEVLDYIKAFQYPPLIRPYLLKQHYTKFPELKDKAVFYTDSDILLTRQIDFDSMLQDNISYMSDSRGYTAVGYFDSKIKDVDPRKLEAYKKIDVVEQYQSILGSSRKIAEENDEGNGGVQYLLKGVDADFWNDVYVGILYVVTYFKNLAQQFMIGNSPQEKERNGFQSWCADLYTIPTLMWKKGLKTLVTKELDFTLRDTPIEEYYKKPIYHDAGLSSVIIDGVEHKLFDKNKIEYKNNIKTPFEDDLSFVSPLFCSYKYAEEIKNLIL